MVDQNGPQQRRAELESGVLGFVFGFGSEPRLELLVQRGDFLDGGFLGSNTGHLKF
jgi:hypothetical protein